jgi:hypothetical protein
MSRLKHILLVAVLVSVAFGADADSRAKRASVTCLPHVDGTVTASDRATIGGVYGGLTLSVEPPAPSEPSDPVRERYNDGDRYDDSGRYGDGGRYN